MTNRKIALTTLFLLACGTRTSPRSWVREPQRTPAPTTIASSETPADRKDAVASVDPSPIIPSEPLRPTEPFTLRDEQGRPIEVYPPSGKTGAVVVVLHATCMEPASVCDAFGDVGRDTGWLVCPSGNTSCNGEPDWHGPGTEKAAYLDRAIAHVEAALPSLVDDSPGVLVGWSRGAYAARDIVYTMVDQPHLTSLGGRFRGLVLIAAQITPDVKKLRAAGITRVVMAAGTYDGARSTMVAAVARLKAQGLEARFVSLGNIGHVWPTDFSARMKEPLAWAGGVSSNGDE